MTDHQHADGNCSLHAQTHGGAHAPMPQIQYVDGESDGALKVSTYEMQLGDGSHAVQFHGHWVNTTRLSVANPQKGFRNR